jgi:hypothetical protein
MTPRLHNCVRRSSKLFTTVALPLTMLISVAGSPALARAQDGNRGPQPPITGPRVILPLVQCWYKGKVAYYIQTDASDQSIAAQFGINYVPLLSGAIDGQAVDDIYHVTNFNQGNVIPSAPIPAGPGNTDPNYSPNWQLSLVTWRSGTTPYILKSEEDVLDAQSKGLVDIVKTNIVINCPVIYTPYGGKLPSAMIIGDQKDHDQSRPNGPDPVRN